jgi:hypothetical protein
MRALHFLGVDLNVHFTGGLQSQVKFGVFISYVI